MSLQTISRILSLALVFCIAGVYSHSWVQCVDYRPQTATDVTDYNPKACKAWPRSWVQKSCPQTNSVSDFAVDCGYNYQGGIGGSVCGTARGSPLTSQYTSNAPMAKYAPGQVVCLAWPPKNHVGLTCPGSNQWSENIVDHGTQIWMTGPDATADPTITATATGAKTVQGASLIQDWGKCLDKPNQAFKSFMNCPRFCTNIPASPGNALCSNCFQLPTNLQVGSIYTFVWAWWFNSDTDLYSNCWEAQIVASPDTAPADGFKAYTSFSQLPAFPIYKPSGGAFTAVAWDYFKATYNPPTGTPPTFSPPTDVPLAKSNTLAVNTQGIPTNNNNGGGGVLQTVAGACNDPTFCAKLCGDSAPLICECVAGQFTVQCSTGSVITSPLILILFGIIYFLI